MCVCNIRDYLRSVEKEAGGSSTDERGEVKEPRADNGGKKMKRNPLQEFFLGPPETDG
jgi:hypothetical protein